MSFVRLPGQEEIDHDLLSRMILLIKHLRRAMLLHARVSMVEEALIMSNKALDLMEHGLVLLADDGEMLFVNSAAERIFDAGDGLSLRNNSIAIANADAKEKFCAMMEKVMQPGIPLSMRAGGYVKVPRKSFGRPYGLMAVPLPRTSSADLDAVGTAIFVFDPNTTKTTASDFFASAFDLTPAEAQLATELAQGASLEDYARGKGITRNTVKTQLKFLFAKTGTSRQSELVGVLLRSVSGINLKL